MKKTDGTAITLICFDLGGVLIRLGSSATFRSMAGVDARAASLLRDNFHRDQSDFSLLESYQLGHIDSTAYFATLRKELRLDLSLEELEARFVRECIAGDNAECVDLLGRLRPLIKLACFSNTCAAHWSYILKTFPWMSWFDLSMASHLEGHAKPQLQAFEAICRKGLVRPAECLFIDDREANIEGAAAMGMHTHLFRSAVELRAALQGLKIL
ncbi:MAG: HAD family phosphatase [Bdellovibrionota bacterium]|nr:MAG: HAD family phosphatase [Bdellovibrionota bacterium]